MRAVFIARTLSNERAINANYSFLHIYFAFPFLIVRVYRQEDIQRPIGNAVFARALILRVSKIVFR